MHRMNRFRGTRARRAPALVVALALFLLGGNYCVLSGLAGDTGMACLSLPADAAAAAVPACHRAAPQSEPGSNPPAARPSCCPDPVLTPAAPVIEKADGGFASLADLALAAVASPASPAALDRHGQRPAYDDHPPTRLACAPAPARAPPLA